MSSDRLRSVFEIYEHDMYEITCSFHYMAQYRKVSLTERSHVSRLTFNAADMPSVSPFCENLELNIRDINHWKTI